MSLTHSRQTSFDAQEEFAGHKRYHGRAASPSRRKAQQKQASTKQEIAKSLFEKIAQWCPNRVACQQLTGMILYRFTDFQVRQLSRSEADLKPLCADYAMELQQSGDTISERIGQWYPKRVACELTETLLNRFCVIDLLKFSQTEDGLRALCKDYIKDAEYQSLFQMVVQWNSDSDAARRLTEKIIDRFSVDELLRLSKDSFGVLCEDYSKSEL
jgi:hypothetical protein